MIRSREGCDALRGGQDGDEGPRVPAELLVAVEEGAVRVALAIGRHQLDRQQWNLLLSLVPEEEARRIQKFYHDKDRKLALGSCLLQRAMASWMLKLPWKEVVVERPGRGKPHVECGASRYPGWNYNISHHGDLVVAACEPRLTVGVDLVNLGDRPFEDMSCMQYVEHFQRHLTSYEWNLLTSVEDDDAMYRAFYRIWALKEAYVKAIGQGLAFSIRRLECHIEEPTAPHTPGSLSHPILVIDGELAADWALTLEELPGGYVCATALGDHSHGEGICCWGKRSPCHDDEVDRASAERVQFLTIEQILPCAQAWLESCRT